MRAAAKSSNEAARLLALDAYQLLDTREASAYEAFTHLARELAETPMSTISLVDDRREWFKSHCGIDPRETPREVAFSGYIVASGLPLIVEDASTDKRFRDNPLVKGPSHVRFYAGVPLIAPDGAVIGALCVLDERPRTLEESQLRELQALAGALMDTMESRRRLLALFDAAHADVLAVDAESETIFFASRGACGRLGYSMKELVGMPIFDVLPNMTEAAVLDILVRGRKGEDIVRQGELRRRDGTSYPVEIRIDVTNENGRERIHAVAFDMSARRAQEREIALLLDAINVAGDVILVYTVSEDGDLTLSYANDAFTRQTQHIARRGDRASAILFPPRACRTMKECAPFARRCTPARLRKPR